MVLCITHAIFSTQYAVNQCAVEQCAERLLAVRHASEYEYIFKKLAFKMSNHRIPDGNKLIYLE